MSEEDLLKLLKEKLTLRVVTEAHSCSFENAEDEKTLQLLIDDKVISEVYLN
jgi:hypothetical protein